MDKQKRYSNLVEKRKNFTFQEGLRNPADSGYDCEEIEPWARWQNNLDAEIMIIGQEFSDFATFKNIKGEVERFDDIFEYPSNKNLRKLLQSIDRDPGHPKKPTKNHKLFFTNCVMGLKDGSMSANFKDKWLKNSRIYFLKPLIEIINPKIIICLGTKPALSISKIFGFKMEVLNKMIQKNPISVKDKIIFTMYHTGGLGIRNRSFQNQTDDWEKIKVYL